MNKIAIIGPNSPALRALVNLLGHQKNDLNLLTGMGGFSYPISNSRNTGAAKAKRAAKKRRNAA